MTEFAATPLTCSSQDAEWSMKLPPIANSANDLTKVELASDQPDAGLFIFSSEDVLAIEPTVLPELISGNLCPEGDDITIDFILSNGGDSGERQSLNVPIKLANETAED